ncbi:programmed cell death 6-interacting protein [Ctenocephalides felis]|uniref:programmed cell death 6-interacting protein n=1 Tax=Ctenocephalides felis TaxID=7515 RepID=UPI000E6E2259|nr:programmed cell death 6-interacting protein [Ctenocephalides felis]
MVEFLSVPLKKPSDVDVVKPLKNLIQSTYSASDNNENYSEAINEFGKIRSNAIWRVFEKYESSLEVIYGYYDQICALEGKIPVHELQVPFKWKDAFDKGSIFGGRMSLTIASLAYEKVCVLFNIAALQSAVAATQSIESDEGLKLAAKLYQQAAGIFNHLKGAVPVAIHQDPTPDLSSDVLSALSLLMVAQAQEIFVHKAIHDDMKDAIIAKLACQCEDLYADTLRAMQKESIKGLWEKEFLPLIAGKQAAYHAITELYQSLVCRANKSIGEEIARLQHALTLFKTAKSASGQTSFFDEFASRATRNLTEVQKDNDFIYHERIPDINSLPATGKANLAKMLSLPDKFSASTKDLFENLVPVSVHQALSSYEMRKQEIVNREITKLRESTQALNGVLASLNLPAAIEVTSECDGLPPSLLEKAETVRSKGGVAKLQTLLHDLPELLQRNKDILDESIRLLDEEESSDNSLREQFKEKWIRMPSAKITQPLKANTDKYQQIINNATQADNTVKQKFQTYLEGMELLSKSNEELRAAIPSGGPCVSDCQSVTTLRNLMETVETIKAERDVIESELKSATFDMKNAFLRALAEDGTINEPAMSMQNLGQIMTPLQEQVKDSVSKQEQLIKDIQEAHAQFTNETGAGTNSRDVKMKQLAAAYDAFTELENNLKEGTTFYNNLTQLLVILQNKISDYCFARKTEKEEMLKDLTQASARASPGATPNIPTHHSTEPASPTSSTSAAGANVPYPTSGQTMPIPYGASNVAPYPTYVPPPMPQGYNPYGTLPYPQGYNYPGFPQAPPYGGYTPSMPYQQQPPQNPQQKPPGW